MIALLLAAAAAQFDPVEFFRGRTQGIGTLKATLQKSKTIRVDSVGKEQKDGALLLCNNGLHIELVLDRSHPIGATDKAGIADIVLEAALTTIVGVTNVPPQN